MLYRADNDNFITSLRVIAEETPPARQIDSAASHFPTLPPPTSTPHFTTLLPPSSAYSQALASPRQFTALHYGDGDVFELWVKWNYFEYEKNIRQLFLSSGWLSLSYNHCAYHAQTAFSGIQEARVPEPVDDMIIWSPDKGPILRWWWPGYGCWAQILGGGGM